MEYLIQIFIEYTTLAVNLLACVVFSVYSVIARKRSLFLVTCIAVVAMSFFHNWLRVEMEKYYHVIDLLHIINALFYLGFAATDFALSLFLLSMTDSKSMMIDRSSILISKIYMFMSIVLVARYIETMVFKVDYFGYFYSSAIPASNMVVSTILCVFCIKLIRSTWSAGRLVHG